MIQSINLNIIPGSEPTVVHVDQFDHGSGRLHFTLLKDGVAYIPSGAAIIQGTKQNNETFQHNVTLFDNVAISDLFEDMTDVSGPVRSQIVLTEGNNRTGTQQFILFVQRTAYDNANL